MKDLRVANDPGVGVAHFQGGTLQIVNLFQTCC